MQIRRPLSDYHRQVIDTIHNKKPKEYPQRHRRIVEKVKEQPRRFSKRLAKKALKNKPVKKVEKKKRIRKIKGRTAAERKKEEKRIAREERTEGKLLKQLTMIQERADRMDRDKEHYCLIDWQKNHKKNRYRFMMVKDDEPYVLKIDVKQNYDTVCNCFDWRIRCRNFMIPCKHVFYVLTRILGYELFEYFDNKIMNKKLFEKLVKEKLVTKKQFQGEQQGDLKDKVCPVCFSDFDGCNRARTVECPDCNNVTHLDCANVWMEHSVRKACAICAGEGWRRAVEARNK